MRTLFILLLLSNTLVLHAQSKKFSISLHVRPEITSFPYDYSSSGQDITTRYTLNTGIRGSIQYRLQKHLFVETGVGYIMRKFQIKAFFDQSAIPPPRQSFTQELVHADKVWYHILEFPVSIGYAWNISSMSALHVKAGYVFDYLLNARYVNNFSRYDGTYEKKTWLGGSPVAGVGYEYRLLHHMKLRHHVKISCAFTYNLKKIEEPDPYLIRWSKPRVITYRSAAFAIGISKYIN